jgi:hypothetical protein
MRDKSDSKVKTAAAQLRSEVERRRQLQERLRVSSAGFLQSYSDWCVEECRAESARNFNLVGLVRNDQAATFLDYVRTLSSSDREQFALSLCKRSCCDVDLSAEEMQSIEKYLKFGNPNVVHSSGEIVSSVRLGPEQLAIRERFRQRNTTNRLVSQQLRLDLKETGGSMLGKLIRDNTSALWFENEIFAHGVCIAWSSAGHEYCERHLCSQMDGDR